MHLMVLWWRPYSCSAMFTLLKWRKLHVQLISIFIEPSSRWIIVIPNSMTHLTLIALVLYLCEQHLSSLQTTEASWRSDLHRRHMALFLNEPVLQSCFSGGRWSEQQVLVQRNGKNRTLLRIPSSMFSNTLARQLSQALFQCKVTGSLHDRETGLYRNAAMIITDFANKGDRPRAPKH